MDKKSFKSQAYELISQLEDLIEAMPKKGETAEECQRMTLTNSLNQFRYCVNGVVEADFQPETKELHDDN